MPKWYSRFFIGLVLIVVFASHTYSDLLHLEIDGNIAAKKHDMPHDKLRSVSFSQKDLATLPVHVIVTSTNWTPKERWEGPRLLDVLHKAGARGTYIRVFAYDDFTQDIPLAFIKKYDPILAYRENGKNLRLKNFGPLFIIFPRDKYPDELSTISSTRCFVFQVRRIEVE